MSERIAIFGGSFNPPHRGHLTSALAAAEQLRPDRFLIMPDHLPPHKVMSPASPTPQQRLELCRLGFASVPGAEVSDVEVARGGKSYTADTLRQLRTLWPDASFFLLVGTDMLQTLDRWYDSAYIFSQCTVAAFRRAAEDSGAVTEAADRLSALGARVRLISTRPYPAHSTDIREALKARGGTELLTDEVYAYIIKYRLYSAQVDFDWLRRRSFAMLKPSRIPHVRGCEEEAVRLAARWGADPEEAAEAAILHDCTKKERIAEQLRLCEAYGVEIDAMERRSEKLLHARTGAAVAEHEFGCAPSIVSAIRWHTTGRPAMSLLEKIIYMADYIEPTRDFPGVEKLRTLAYEDLDRAMLLGFEMSLEDIRSRGNEAHPSTLEALAYYRERVK